MEREAEEGLNQPGILKVDPSSLLYGSFSGSNDLRCAVANLFNRKLHVVDEPLTSKNVVIGNGAGSILAAISSILGDVGDSIIIPSPVYGQFYGDFKNLGQINPVFVEGPNSVPGIDKLEEAYQATEQRGSKVRALLITNPGNPTGQVINSSIVRSWLWWAFEKGIHCIVDEVYAMSVWALPTDPGYEVFDSVLSMPDLPDPFSVHVVWSFSKDLTMSGMRTGLEK